ncbi:disintegrin and metalloproteinase domain-containing protein 23-like [Latimeria chalumnae]|uniref:disintegrin and metalloproteinase domain-containing protein 23-like n=1 Tax=Latimeria chalumnae TaxID=7897 RepID=UPI00313C8874
MNPMQSWIFAALLYLCSHSGFTSADMQPATSLRNTVNVKWSKRAVFEEITTPKRLLHQSHSKEEVQQHLLNTRVRNDNKDANHIHLAQASFLVEAFGSTFILDLELNQYGNVVSPREEEDLRPQA